MTKMVAVVGVSGFTGKECLRLLARHPEVEVAVAMSARAEPGAACAHAGALREPEGQPFDLEALAGLDAVMLCAPHEASAALVPELLKRCAHVVDLSAGYRLADASLYPRFYEFEHPHPELLAERVFGLTEWQREALQSARLIANPGCYVTSVLLPLLALEGADALAAGAPVIADCKSGVSGAGKGATPTTHFASVHEDFRAYGVGAHRHEPEIREQLGHDRLYFTPHLLPVFRGILSTLHVEPAAGPGCKRAAQGARRTLPRRALRRRARRRLAVHRRGAGQQPLPHRRRGPRIARGRRLLPRQPDQGRLRPSRAKPQPRARSRRSRRPRQPRPGHAGLEMR